LEGFHAGGVACTLKHFPGHGDTAEDSHYGAAYVGKTLDQLR
jgi:beta-N-acetylhexosaminidase